MKKVLSLLFVMLFLSACTSPIKEKTSLENSGLWITYYEINSMLESAKGFKEEWKNVIKNCKRLKIQNLFIHTRAFGDSLYLSDYFPLFKNAQKYDYDVFGHIIDECHKNEIKVHAWINPYRISTATSNIDEIDSDSPAYKWLKDETNENDCNVGFANGIYLNPASSEVRCLVLDGIREMIAKYEIDGVHFDDYFYPTINEDFDSFSYNQYISQTENPLSLGDWRRSNVNALISSCYTAIKFANKNILFSISPAADLERNYNSLYADIEEWVKNGYIDILIPQIYFGFEYPDTKFTFENLLKQWKNLASKGKCQLRIGLAFYKAIPELEADKKEWQENSDIIARQVKICREDKAIDGYMYFSYSSLFSEAEQYTKQRQKLSEYLINGENK